MQWSLHGEIGSVRRCAWSMLFAPLLSSCPESILVGLDAAIADAAPTDAQGQDAASGDAAAEDATIDAGTLASIGDPCPGGDGDCESALCLSPPNGDPICTSRCSPDPPCPDGFACRVMDDGGALVAACAPASGLALGELCTASTQCEIPLCLVLQPGDDVGYCTDRCQNMMCPAGYLCVHFSDLNEDLCAVSDDTADRPSGSPCFASVQCLSALCSYDPAREIGVCR